MYYRALFVALDIQVKFPGTCREVRGQGRLATRVVFNMYGTGVKAASLTVVCGFRNRSYGIFVVRCGRAGRGRQLVCFVHELLLVGKCNATEKLLVVLRMEVQVQCTHHEV